MPAASFVALHTIGLPVEYGRRLAALCGLPVWEAWLRAGRVGLEGSDRVVVLLAPDGDGELEESWTAPQVAWIEPGNLGDDAVRSLIDRALAKSLFVSLTSATANQVFLANRLMARLAQHRQIAKSRREDVELAVHEAISNALIHGNLQIEGFMGMNVTDLDAFSASFVDRLADERLAGRRVEVSFELDDRGVTVEVLDEGGGYLASDHPKQGARGRGLQLIAAAAEKVAILDGGRRIRTWFEL